ncbi:MAG: histidinol-phosphate transaminase [Gemmatimonadaceae bacterium]
MQSLPLYAPDAVACAIDLSDNTNLWGAPPAALRALGELPAAALSRYPTLYSEPLRDALLNYSGAASIAYAGVVTGCGSDDVLDSTMRAFGAPGDAVAFCAPTFSMIPVLARLNGLVPTPLPFTDTFDIDADQLVECGAKITYICAPNNPTATAVSRDAVRYVVANARGIVLIDEAYAEFAPDVFVDLLATSEHLVIARTFSKAFGLAGLRVGYAVGTNDMVRLIERARGPYKVSSLAERAVLAALGDDDGGVRWVHQHAGLAIANRARLCAELVGAGFTPIPSAANFVMVPAQNAAAIQLALAARGILVRAFGGMRGDTPALAASGGAALRIGVGPWDMMTSLLDALREVA